jgi:outer membrane protein assembly factor BamB
LNIIKVKILINGLLLFCSFLSIAQKAELTVSVLDPAQFTADGIIRVTSTDGIVEKTLVNGTAYFELKVYSGLDDFENRPAISIYPNPVKERIVTLTIQGSRSEEGRFNFFNITGKKLGSMVAGDASPLTLSNAKGIILYQYLGSDGHSIWGKIVALKERIGIQARINPSDHSSTSPALKGEWSLESDDIYTITYIDPEKKLGRIRKKLSIPLGVHETLSWEAIISCGIDDLDMIRYDLNDSPTTASNATSRRAALYRWWRLLWRQGYDMSSFDATANRLIINGDETQLGRSSITEGYGVLEDLMANPVIIPEIKGTPGLYTTSTNWPVYHGTDGKQTGYSPDEGPSEGKLAWHFPLGHNWHLKPVISNGKVYASSPGLDVIAYCLDEKTGEIIWNGRQNGTHNYHTTGSRWAPVVSGEQVLIQTGWWQNSIMHVLDKNTGATKLVTNAGSVSGGTGLELMVYKRYRWNVILADSRTGAGIWQFNSGGNLAGEPILAGAKVFAARQSGIVYCFSTGNSTPLWQKDMGTNLRGTPGLGNETVYVGTTDNKLLALSTSDGTLQWSYQAGESENRAYQFFTSALETGDRIYVGAASGYLYCLDKINGNLLWKHPLSDWIRSRPLVFGDTVYVATLDSKLYALKDEGSSASELWQIQLGEHGISTDLTGNSNGILVSGRDLMLYSVAPGTGEIQWRHGLLDGTWIDDKFYAADIIGGQYQTSPVVVDSVVFTGGPGGFLHAIDVRSGRKLWRFETNGIISATPRVAEGKVFVGQHSKNLEYYAVNQKTGEPVWIIENLGWTHVGATGYARNRIFVGTVSGKMHAIDADDGSILWTFNAGQNNGFYPHPATDSARVYTGSHDGYYYAFDQVTGDVVWSTNTSNPDGTGGKPDSAAPVLWKGKVYVQKRGHWIAALDQDTGAQLWEWEAPGGFLQNGTIAAYDNKIFGSAIRLLTAIPYNSSIYAFNDVENGGNKLWEYKGGGGLTAPVVAEGKLIFGSTGDVFLTCLNPNDGSVIWRFYTGGAMDESVPALYGNKVIVLCRNGYLFAVK